MMNSKKGIAAHVLTIIVIIALFGFFILLIVFTWIDTSNQQASQALCSAKILSYCADWFKNGFKDIPWSWSQKGPQGCEKFNINQPVNPDDCKNLLGTK